MQEVRGEEWIVIPTYNERKNIEALIPKVFSVRPDVHVLVVDDLSPDGTQEVVRELIKSYPQVELYAHNQKAGFAKAYIDGFKLLLNSSRDIGVIVMMDADLSHNPNYLSTVFEQLETHDLVTGSRYIPGGSIEGWEWWRAALSFWGNEYLRMVSGLRMRDITSGFNGIRASALRGIDLEEVQARGYGFQFLLKLLLLEKGARAFEIPIVFRNRTEGESKLTHQIITEALFLPWKMKRRARHVR